MCEHLHLTLTFRGGRAPKHLEKSEKFIENNVVGVLLLLLSLHQVCDVNGLFVFSLVQLQLAGRPFRVFEQICCPIH